MTRTDGGITQTVSHDANPNSNRTTTTWDGLSPRTTYTFKVKCKIQGEDCQGNSLTFTATTSRYFCQMLKT